MRAYLHLRYSPNNDVPGKWSVWTSKGALRFNLFTFEEADRWAHEFCRDTGSVYGDDRIVDEPSWRGGRSGYFDQDYTDEQLAALRSDADYKRDRHDKLAADAREAYIAERESEATA